VYRCVYRCTGLHSSPTSLSLAPAAAQPPLVLRTMRVQGHWQLGTLLTFGQLDKGQICCATAACVCVRVRVCVYIKCVYTHTKMSMCVYLCTEEKKQRQSELLVLSQGFNTYLDLHQLP
jgi:hypothetical protein